MQILKNSSGRRAPVAVIALAWSLLLACSACGSDTRTPWLLIGIDSMDLGVVEALWSDGELPHLRSLADRGVRARLDTRYTAPPVIWTSIATGVTAERHGIRGYVQPSLEGDRPLHSNQRQAPALWDLMTDAERPVAVLGWWATWPVDEVAGTMVSDLYGQGLGDDVHPQDAADGLDPAALTREWRRLLGLPEAHPYEVAVEVGVDEVFRRRYGHDAIVAESTRRAVASGRYDLVMSYFRSVAATSALNFGCWDRKPQPGTECRPGRVRRAYAVVDAALGSILESTDSPLNIVVVSDHGFRRLRPALRTYIDLDGLLERFGYLTRHEDGSVDLGASRFIGYGNAPGDRYKKVRRLPAASDADEAALRKLLLSLRYEGGGRVFGLARRAGPTPDTAFVVAVTRRPPSVEVHADGIEPFPLIDKIIPLTGARDRDSQGFLIAAGPSVGRGQIEDGHIFDIAPTLAYAVGLPVAEDSDGRVMSALFADSAHQGKATPQVGTGSDATANNRP